MLLRYKAGEHAPQAHGDVHSLPVFPIMRNMQIDTGSLGQALSTAAGIASAEKLSSARIPTRVAVILGDGECQEGQIYESLMSIVHMKLKNITIIVDLNGYQSDRKCDEIMPIHDLATVFKGFGFRMIFINGH